MIKSKLLPKDTKDIVDNLNNNTYNYYIKFMKFIEYNFYKKEFNKNILDKVEVFNPFQNDENNKIMDCFCGQNNYFHLIAKTNLPLIIGLGSESVYEISITLNYIYGCPYIPASSLKGCLRSLIIKKYFDKNENEAIRNEDFIKIFGSAKKNKNDLGQKGGLLILDSYNSDNVFIKPDILTPHFPKYYKDPQNNPPSDTDTPIPINFLTVSGTFSIYAGLTENINFSTNIFQSNNPLLFLKNEMIDMLKNHGIGAKTSVGYGYFKVE